MIDFRDSRPITAVEAAAFLGVTAGAIRKIVSRHNIEPAGKQGRAKVYWMHEIARHAGAHDRLLTGKQRRGMSH